MCGSTRRADGPHGQRTVGSALPCPGGEVPQAFACAVGSSDISLGELTGCLFEKEAIVEGREGRRERDSITAASAAYLNTAFELIGHSIRLLPTSRVYLLWPAAQLGRSAFAFR